MKNLFRWLSTHHERYRLHCSLVLILGAVINAACPNGYGLLVLTNAAQSAAAAWIAASVLLAFVSRFVLNGITTAGHIRDWLKGRLEAP